MRLDLLRGASLLLLLLALLPSLPPPALPPLPRPRAILVFKKFQGFFEDFSTYKIIRLTYCIYNIIIKGPKVNNKH